MNEQPVSLDQQIQCVEKEIAYRERAYSHSLAAGKMTHLQFAVGIDEMRAVLKTLLSLTQESPR